MRSFFYFGKGVKIVLILTIIIWSILSWDSAIVPIAIDAIISSIVAFVVSGVIWIAPENIVEDYKA